MSSVHESQEAEENNFEFINLTDENYRDYVDKPRLDLDSIVIGSENLATFGYHMSFYLMIAQRKIHPGTQKKVHTLLDNSNEWWQFYLGTADGIPLYVYFTRPKTTKKLQMLHKKFLCQVIRKAARMLTLECESRINNAADFLYGDRKRQPLLFPADWDEFSKWVSKILPSWKIANGVDKLLFVRWLHGKKMVSGSSLQTCMTKLNVDMASKLSTVVQIHLANTFVPLEKDSALMIDFKKMENGIKSFASKYTLYRHFFFYNVGSVTSNSKAQNHADLDLPDYITYLQTYYPEVHAQLLSKKRFDNFFMYVLCGGFRHPSIWKYRSLKVMKTDVMSSIKELRNLLYQISQKLKLRFEEVATFQGNDSLTEAIQYNNRVQEKQLIEAVEVFLQRGYILLVRQGWTKHISQSIADELDLLERSVNYVNKKGGRFVTRSLAECVYNAHMKIILCVNGAPWQVHMRRLYPLMLNQQGGVHVQRLQDSVDSLGRIQFRDRCEIEIKELFDLPQISLQRLGFHGPPQMKQYMELCHWRSALLETHLSTVSESTTKKQRTSDTIEWEVNQIILILGNIARIHHGFPQAERYLDVDGILRQTSIKRLQANFPGNHVAFRGRFMASEMVELILNPESYAGSIMASSMESWVWKTPEFAKCLKDKIESVVEVFPMSVLKKYPCYYWYTLQIGNVTEIQAGDTGRVRQSLGLSYYGKKPTTKYNLKSKQNLLKRHQKSLESSIVGSGAQ